MKYQIVSDFFMHELEQKVTALLEEGWELQGGVACSEEYGLYQAMAWKEPPFCPRLIRYSH